MHYASSSLQKKKSIFEIRHLVSNITRKGFNKTFWLFHLESDMYIYNVGRQWSSTYKLITKLQY